MKNCLWTSLKARLQCLKTMPGSNVNWLFLAGGPGLGSESLSPLTQLLQLPGTLEKLVNHFLPHANPASGRGASRYCEVFKQSW